jgi:hypothetical protein
MLADRLTDEQLLSARKMWSKGLSLIDIADALGKDTSGQKVGIYHLSPWLYSGSMRQAMQELTGLSQLRKEGCPAPAFNAVVPGWRARLGW